MTRANITIAILAVLVLVLCGFCYVGKPLITGQYVPEVKTLTQDISRNNIGGQVLTHYIVQLGFLINFGAEPYKGVTQADKEKISMFLMSCLFAGVVAIAGAVASAALFVVNLGQQPPISKTRMVATVVMVVLAGTMVRLILAASVYGNIDMQAYEADVRIVSNGGNIYAETDRYNYSPVWFLTLYALKRIQLALPGVSFHFAVKAFLCVIDLLTLAVLLLIARIRKLSPVAVAIFFYLNPVSYLMTGYHGQFENFAMLGVLIGVFLYLWLADRPIWGTVLLWLFATAGMIVKHNTFYELIICLHSAIRRYWVKMSLFVISVAVFLSLFIPYWAVGGKGIIENVFKYGSGFGAYGLTWLFEYPWLKNLFILAMFVFPLFLRGRDIIARCLLGTLFFLTFTTGIAIQYFVFPIAIGALRSSIFLLVYTIFATLFMFGSVNNVFIPGFQIFQWNIVWVGAACWFVAEMWFDRQSAVKIEP
jgi:hypothetical protein